MTGSRRTVAVMLALAAACFAVYGAAVRAGFLNFDDPGYVTGNQWVNHGITAAGVRWAFTSIDWFYWQPLTWLSHMLDCQLWGLWPAGHHLTSVLFHVANTLLLFALLRRLTGAYWRSAAATALFALHPLRVESVVWIAERKDLLSSFWFLAAIWLYLNYVERPSQTRYNLVLGAFALGLMAKPMVMTLPVILLLLDWWPLGRRAIGEKAPLLAMALASALITSIGTARLGIANWGASLTLGQRAANALVSYVRYLELSFWPHDLAILYPFDTRVPLWQAAAAALLLAGITGIALWQAKRRPWLPVGWLWFAIMLLPASGLKQVGRQGMADRFTYLPHIGLAIAVVWCAAEALGGRRRAAALVFAGAAACLAAGTAQYVPLWRDDAGLFARAVAVTRGNSGAEYFLASALEARGRYREALPHYAEAVRIEPTHFVAQYAYGAALEREGRLAEAAGCFREALRRFPDYPDARSHLEAVQKALDLSKASGLRMGSER